MNVIAYCTEEVERQGHDTTTLSGISRVGFMIDAWSYAIRHSVDRLPKVVDVHRIGIAIEPARNFKDGFRGVPVFVGSRKCPAHKDVPKLLDGLFSTLNQSTEPFGFYRQLLEIHPFVDGNRRTGKVILNWLNGTLLDPIFPSAAFWGKPIKYP